MVLTTVLSLLGDINVDIAPARSHCMIDEEVGKRL